MKPCPKGLNSLKYSKSTYLGGQDEGPAFPG